MQFPRYSLIVPLAAAMLAPASACPKAQVDDRQFTFGGAPLSKAADVKDGKLTFTVPRGEFGALLEGHDEPAKGDLCLDIAAESGPDDRDAGLSFWATRGPNGNPRDFYAFSAGPRGNFTVQRMQNGALHLIASGSPIRASQHGPISYEVKARLDGRRVTLSLDGSVVASFEGAPPNGHSYAGIFAEASAFTDTAFDFADVHTGAH